MPDLVTGGEALADLLRSEGCNLKSLKLGAWRGHILFVVFYFQLSCTHSAEVAVRCAFFFSLTCVLYVSFLFAPCLRAALPHTGWNMIRLDGAADLCSSLIVNTTLTYLDLSFNSLGSIGGELAEILSHLTFAAESWFIVGA
jgi:hypothetical protein